MSELLRERLGPTSDYAQSLIEIQAAYINTNHPAFISGSAAASQQAPAPPKPLIAPRVRYPSSGHTSFQLTVVSRTAYLGRVTERSVNTWRRHRRRALRRLQHPNQQSIPTTRKLKPEYLRLSRPLPHRNRLNILCRRHQLLQPPQRQYQRHF